MRGSCLSQRAHETRAICYEIRDGGARVDAPRRLLAGRRRYIGSAIADREPAAANIRTANCPLIDREARSTRD